MSKRIAIWDEKIIGWIQRNCRREGLDQVMALATHLGDLGLVWVLWGTVLFVTQRQKGILLLGSIVVCALVCNLTLKPLFRRQRPFQLQEEAELLIREPQDPSFPSGHTMASFTAAAVLLSVCGGGTGALALALALLIGWTRLYLFVHHPSDVAAGAVFGLLLGKVCVLWGQQPAQRLAQWSVWFLGF